MPNELSPQQLQISYYRSGSVVIKACPGSGKTFSVAARIADILRSEKFYNKGIATLSFTNIACEEISEKLNETFGISRLHFPHFIGTIDKFINTYLFLPYGHLVMGCDKRPELVGDPHKSWTKGKGDKTYTTVKGQRICTNANPDGYFDCTSFNENDMLIPIVSEREIHFSLKPEKYYKVNGDPKKQVKDVIDAKLANFKLGFANQSDANYLSLKVLEKFPLISCNIANRFKYFIIDEAQDTDAIQMRIMELLKDAGTGNIMLIGDRDQSIFEWKSADPSLFDEKYNSWEKVTLNENRRSSQRICNFTSKFSSFDRSFAINPDIKSFDHIPEILPYPWEKKVNGIWTVSPGQSKQGLLGRLSYFCASCEQNGISINEKNVAVLFRGWKQAEFLDIKKDLYDYEKNPWAKHHYHVKDILKGFILFSKGLVKEGYGLLEKGYFEALQKSANPSFHCSQQFIDAKTEREGLRLLRDTIFQFIRLLPSFDQKSIREWVLQTNQALLAAHLPINLQVNSANSAIQIEDYFAGELTPLKKHPFYCGTIHSVKGKTFDAVFLMIGKKAGSTNYTTILNRAVHPSDEEELRNIYVAITRPRKILMIAVPEDNEARWREAFSQ